MTIGWGRTGCARPKRGPVRMRRGMKGSWMLRKLIRVKKSPGFASGEEWTPVGTASSLKSEIRNPRADCKSPVDERFLGYLSWVLPSPFPSRIFCHPFFARIRDGDAMRSLNQPASRNRRTRQQKKVGKKWMAKNEAHRSLKKLQNLRRDFKSPSFRRPAPSNYTNRLIGSDSAFCNCLPKSETNPKPEVRRAPVRTNVIRISDFELFSGFGFRIS